MAENSTALKRGFHYDKANSRLEIWVDGVEQARFGATTTTLLAAGTAELVLSASALYPSTTDGQALGTSSYMFSDLFLASGAVVNFNAGDVTLTHSSNLLTLVGGGFTAGAVGAPAGDFTWWGTNGAETTYRLLFDVDGDTNGAFYFGGDDYGMDVGFYGQTASNAMLWDASNNALIFTAGSLRMGTGSSFLLPVKASGESTKGYVWLDTTDNYIHFYGSGAELVVTCTAA